MPAYIQLVRWGQEAHANVKRGPDALKQARADAEKVGVRNIGFWVTMGEYDAVAIWEAPDDPTFAAFTLTQTRSGAIMTQTLRAFSEDEFAQIVGKLP